MTREEVQEWLAEECRVDYVGLWEIVHAARFDLGLTIPSEIQTVTLQLVRDLLQDPDMQVGHPAPDGNHFVAWDLPADQAVDRIEHEWAALGHEPDIGEVAWFTDARKPLAPGLTPSPKVRG